MNKLALSLAVIAGIVASACSGNQSASTGNAPAAAPAEATATPLNIRYIDADSITLHYNLAKDLNELQIRAFSKLENARQSRATEIQRFGQQIEQKMRSNGYLTEDSYNADVAKFNKMQQDAQNQLANMERNTQQEMAAQQQQLMDSLRRLRVDHASIATDEDFSRALMTLFQGRGTR